MKITEMKVTTAISLKLFESASDLAKNGLNVRIF